MTKIEPTKNHTIEIFTTTNIDISKLPNHPNILFPQNADKQYNKVVLSYNVLANGSTLREFINKGKTTRLSVRKIHVWSPTDIILQIISACEFMATNNLITHKTNFNPDKIWLQYNEHGKLCAFVIYAFENVTDQNDLLYLDERSKNYWAPEILRKHNQTRFYYDREPPIVKHESVLIRRNTLASTLQIVYSLGLILYFIVYKEDAFPELRIHEDDMPSFRSINKYTDYIKVVVQPEAKDRMTLTDWSFMLQTTPSTRFCCIHF